MNVIDLPILSDFYWGLESGEVKQQRQRDLFVLDTKFWYVLRCPIMDNKVDY